MKDYSASQSGEEDEVSITLEDPNKVEVLGVQVINNPMEIEKIIGTIQGVPNPLCSLSLLVVSNYP